jgi:hypothetical protein
MGRIKKYLGERYEVTSADEIMRIGPFPFRKKYKIHADEIVRWSIFPEMTFDVVIIELNDNMQVVWLDRNNDLISALRVLVPAKEKDEPTRND